MEIINLKFMGVGEKNGLDFYDEITRIEKSTDFQPPKEYIYILGLLILFITIVSQKSRLMEKKLS